MKERLVGKRVANLVLLLLIILGTIWTLGYLRGLYLDEILGLAFLGVMFYVILVYQLEHNRVRMALSNNPQNDYGKAVIGFWIGAVITVAGSFFPEFLKPFILIPLFMTALATPQLAICAGIFFDGVLCLAINASAQEVILYGMMVLFGSMLATSFEENKNRIWSALISVALSVMMPGIFYYITYCETSPVYFLYGALEGVFFFLCLLLFYDKLSSLRKNEVQDKLMDLLDDTYPLARELAKFSKADYQHAKRVSQIAARCAGEIGADAGVCAVAGLYYRIGIIEGEPVAENGVRLAQRECFPQEILQIISEYNGVLAEPSTAESAIVHMVDGVIKKLEVLGEQTTGSDWNQDMVIYQTLNEFSAEGLYDKSGISMNMFLKIREYLVKEEALL